MNGSQSFVGAALRPDRDTRPLLQGTRRLSAFYNPIHNPTTADTLQIPHPDTLPVT